MEPGGSHGLQNRPRPDFVGLGGFDSHALPPPAVTLRAKCGGFALMSLRTRIHLVAALSLAMSRPLLAQQRPDTAAMRRLAPNPAVDSLRPPLGPRRAFFYSFLLPGYSQSVLHRHKAAAGFMLFEGIAIAMVRESAADVHEARRMERDTAVYSWVDASGNARLQTDSARFTSREVHSRLSHVEDW